MKSYLLSLPKFKHKGQKIDFELSKTHTKRTDVQRALIKFREEEINGFRLQQVGKKDPPFENDKDAARIPGGYSLLKHMAAPYLEELAERYVPLGEV